MEVITVWYDNSKLSAGFHAGEEGECQVVVRFKIFTKCLLSEMEDSGMWT